MNTYLPDISRLLPQSPDAEQGVIGAFLLAPDATGDLCAQCGISAEHFHIPSHAAIFAVLIEHWRSKTPLDFIALTNTLRDRNQLEQVGGAAFITSLFTFLPTAANAGYYTELLRNKWLARRTITLCTEAAARAYDEPESPAEIITELSQNLAALLDAGAEHDPDERTMRERVNEWITHLEELYDRKEAITGLPIGIKSFDEHTGGVQPGEMIVICGSTKSGKTSLAMQALITNLVAGVPCSMASLEMSTRQLIGRIIASVGRINGGLFRKPRTFSENDFAKINKAGGITGAFELRIHERKRTLSRIAAAIERDVRKHGVRLACIDYAQLVDGERGREENREREVARISATAKQIAVRNNIAVLLLSQTNDDGKLRESRAIGQDADAVLKVRVPVKDGTKPPEPDLASNERTIVVEYARSFEARSFPVTFINSQTRFEDRPGAADSQA